MSIIHSKTDKAGFSATLVTPTSQTGLLLIQYANIITSQNLSTCTKISYQKTVKVFDLHFCNSCYIKIDRAQVRLVKMIGLEGSFGTVYRAVWRGSIVAVKVIQLGKDVDHVIGDVESVGTLNLC